MTSPPAPGGDVGVPRAVWALVAAFGLLLAVQSVLSPTWRAPDEPAHADMVRTVREAWHWPEPGARMISVRVTGTWETRDYDRFGRGRPLTAAEAPARGERPAFTDLGSDAPSEIPQQMTQHPPLYYLGGAVVLAAVETLPFTLAYDAEVLLLRLYSAALLLPLPLLAWAAAWRATGDRAAGLTAAALPFAVPMLTHIGSAVNNDNLLILLVAAMTPLLVGVARGDLSTRTAVVVGGLGALALLTKGFALALPPWVAAAYLVGLRRRGRAAGGARTAPLVALGVMLAGGLWWWVANVVRHGTLQPLPLAQEGAPAGFEPDLWWWSAFALRRFVTRFWIDQRVVGAGEPPLEILLSVLLAGLAVAAFVLVRTAARRADLAVLCLPFAGMAGLVLVGALRLYVDTGVPRAIQGRYAFPGLTALGVVAAAGLVSVLGRHRRWAPLGVLAVAGALQLHVARLLLDRWWGSPDTGLGDSVRAMLAWSPLAASALAVLLAVLLAASVWAVAALVPAAWDRSPAGERGRAGDRAPAGADVNPGAR